MAGIVGFSSPGSNQNFTGSWKHVLTIERYERVATRAGTFDAFVVSFEQDGISHRYKGTFRQWYAPAPGVTVKFDLADSDGSNLSAEAVSIHR